MTVQFPKGVVLAILHLYERVIDICNSLPSNNAVDFTSLASFKRSISSFDFSQYLVGL